MTMRPIGEVARGVAETVALAAIARAEQDGDAAKAERLRRYYDGWKAEAKEDIPF